MKKGIAGLVAGVAAATAGAALWLRQRQEGSDAPSALEAEPEAVISRSAQPHKKARLRRSAATSLRDVPPPDSAEAGRTPYYFVPGEALLTLHSPTPPDPAQLPQVAARLGAALAPLGSALLSYPDPEKEGWYTVLRLHWEGVDYEGTLERFVALEGQVNAGVAWQETQLQVASWMPNWLGSVASAERCYTPGGPGSYLRPVAWASGALPLTDAPFLREWREGASAAVTLALLDTFPQGQRLERPLPESLQPLVAQLRAGTQPLTVDGERHYATFREGEPFDVGDHGLMAAWLALEVLGEAARDKVTLLPVRVATEEGICAAADVLAGLVPLIERARAGEPLVALLAFVVGMGDIIPPRLRPYEEHYEALRLACLALSEAGATLIGAAGNDATGLQHPPRTRRPAAFRSIIEVTSGQLRQPGLALYANQAKALALFGGESNLANQSAANIPALVGPATAESVHSGPHHRVPNEHGWVAWAGTSFAAALAAGLAVLLRSREPSLPMWDVRTRLRALATESRHPGNVPFVALVRASD